jgi:hypothetical protein
LRKPLETFYPVGWLSLALKGFWALWNNIYECVRCYDLSMVVLLRDFGPKRIIFMNACVVITVAMVMLLKYFRPYGQYL